MAASQHVGKAVVLVGGIERKGTGILEVASVALVAIFGVVVLFWLFGFIAGAIWWTIKMVVLIGVLFLAVRWAFKRVAK